MGKFRNFWERWKTKIRNKVYWFPQLRVNMLERHIRELMKSLEAEKQRKVQYDDLLHALNERLQKGNTLRNKAFRDNILWKALFLKKLIAEKKVCEKCSTANFTLTVDHIIPVSILLDLGIDADYERDPRNFRLLCKLCNNRKGHHLDFTDPRTKPLLAEYLTRVPGVTRFEDIVEPKKAEEPKKSLKEMTHAEAAKLAEEQFAKA